MPFHGDCLLARLRSLAELKYLADHARRSNALNGVADEVRGGAPPSRIVVLDPNPQSRERLVEILSPGYAIDAAAHAERWIGPATTGACHLALISHEWPDGNGVRWAHQLRLRDPKRSLRVVLIADRDDLAFRSWESAADDILTRPLDRSQVLARVGLAARKHHLAAGLAQTRPSAAASVPGISPFGRRPPDRFAA